MKTRPSSKKTQTTTAGRERSRKSGPPNAASASNAGKRSLRAASEGLLSAANASERSRGAASEGLLSGANASERSRRNTSKRKRGGQPGNTNALKHGFYSSRFSPLQLQILDSASDLDPQAEIDLLTVSIGRFLATQALYPPESPWQNFEEIQAITLAVKEKGRLIRRKRNLSLLASASSDLETWLKNLQAGIDTSQDEPNDS